MSRTSRLNSMAVMTALAMGGLGGAANVAVQAVQAVQPVLSLGSSVGNSSAPQKSRRRVAMDKRAARKARNRKGPR